MLKLQGSSTACGFPGMPVASGALLSMFPHGLASNRALPADAASVARMKHHFLSRYVVELVGEEEGERRERPRIRGWWARKNVHILPSD